MSEQDMSLKKPSFDISGKVIAITGAAGIICGEMSREMAALGARVVLLDFALERAQALAAEIRAAGGEATALYVNVVDKPSIEQALADALAAYGRVDALINGAGGNQAQATASDELSFFDIPEDAMRRVFDLNMMGTLLPSQVFGRYFMRERAGAILNISSMGALRPLTRVVGYSAAKASVSNLTQWMATYFAKNGAPQVRVNAIAPGFLLTEQNRFLMTDRETGEPTARGRHVLTQTPMGRYGSPDEMVGAAAFLLSDAASFITGVVLPIDGGFSIFAI